MQKIIGIPQNRERVFTISIRNDIYKEFTFPLKQELHLRLKDMLEDEVEERYYLSEELEKKLSNKFTGEYDLLGGAQEHQVVKKDGVCTTLTSSMGAGGGYIPMVSRIGGIFDTDGKVKQAGGIFDKDGLAPTLTDMQGGYRQPLVEEPKIIRHDIVQQVRVRKYPVDTDKLVQVLRNAKIEKDITNNMIATQLDVPVTKVEHWFRRDECFAIPDEDIWFKLKELLGIATDEFDKAIMTFEVKDGVYDKANRVYEDNGLAPTLTQQEEKVINNCKIRKLTPRECFRLMGFTDEEFDKASVGVSNTQLYKMAGNSIVVNVLVEIFKNLFDDLEDK